MEMAALGPEPPGLKESIQGEKMQKDSCRGDKAGGGQHFVPQSREALSLIL